MKKYLVTVKRTQITSMMVSANNSQSAVDKTKMIITNCEKSNVNLEKIFDKGSIFKYKAEVISDKSQDCK